MVDNNTIKNNVKNKEIDLTKYPIDFRDTFYANGIRIVGTQLDFVLDFFEQPPKDEGCFEGIRIFVNPVSLKVFSNLIIDQLKQYEKMFGEIKV